MQDETNLRNLIIAMVAIIGIMTVWQLIVWGPEQKAAQEAFERNQAAKAATEIAATPANDVATGGEGADAAAPTQPVRQDVRVGFDAPEVDGSILLRGARIDNLKLKEYFETLEDKEQRNTEGEVAVFEPQGSGDGYFGFVGWTRPEGGLIADANSNWEQVNSGQLTPDNPLSLRLVENGFEIARTISVDEHFMFTFEDRLINRTDREQGVQQYGRLRQFGIPDDLANFYILHEGLVAAAGRSLTLEKYKQLEKGASVSKVGSEGGWIGLTGKYWLGAVIPDPAKPFTLEYETLQLNSGQVFQATAEGPVTMVAPGGEVTSVTRVYGGAKVADILRGYQKDLGIPRFVDAIDWGSMFFWLTKPFFAVLTFINDYVGNFGVSILLLTVLVKLVFFPIQNKAYQSMAKMREIAEPMKKIREEVEDKQEQQRQIMALYSEKKVNPVAGCLPILIQIPVFYGLYKTLFVTIEMRHEPFFGWIKDLSAPDPSAIGNLFGLLPISVETLEAVPLLGPFLLTLGVLPIMYGLTMWALQSLNPPPPDETQRMIFAFLPIVFTFVFAGFMAGLVIYWVWSNILSILQQYTIMRQNGVKTELDKFIERKFGKGQATE